MYIPGGRYIIEEVLGNGGSGTVYRVKDNVLGVQRAAKYVGDSSCQKGNNEAYLLSSLKHEALPEVYDFISSDGGSWTIYEIIEGFSALDMLKNKGRFAESECIYIGLKICSVLNYLHGFKTGAIYHGDLKPSNIMLQDDVENKYCVRLIDFGAAVQNMEPENDSTQQMGTLAYAPPEQIRFGRITAQSDIYSLGRTLIHMLTGSKPALSEWKDMPDISPGIKKVLEKCTTSNPDDRYESVTELEKALLKLSKTGRSSVVKKRGKINVIRKSIITVAGNHEFACEIAYCAAKMYPIKILIVDCDWISWKTPVLLEFPLDMINDYTADKLIFTGRPENLSITYLPQILESKTYLFEGKFSDAALKLSKEFDFVILSLPNLYSWKMVAEVYDISDLCVIPLKQDFLSVLDYTSFVKLLGRKADKLNFVFYEKAGGIFDYQKDIIRYGNFGRYVGSVPYRKERVKCRNNGLSYAKRHYRDIAPVYSKIFEKTGLFIGGVK